MDSTISIDRGYSSRLLTVNDHHLSSYFRRHNKFRRTLILISVVTALILAAVIISSFAAGGALINNTRSSAAATVSKKTPPSFFIDADFTIIRTVCNVTHYPISCATSLLQHQDVSRSSKNVAAAGGGGGGDDLVHALERILKLSLSIALNELANLSTTIPLKLTKTMSNYIYNFNTGEDGRIVRIESALRDCHGLTEDAVDKLETSISSIETSTSLEASVSESRTETTTTLLLTKSKMGDIRTWLSGALTDQDTCLDSLEEMMDSKSDDDGGYNLPEETKTAMKKAREYTSNCLAIVSNFHTILRDLHRLLHRRR